MPLSTLQGSTRRLSTRSDHYWSSSTYACDPDDAWVVDFYSGDADWDDKDDYDYVRCVRGGPFWPFDPSDRLQIVDDDTAKDTLTNLVWQRSDDGQKRSWNDALDYCADLILAGKNDWRLPPSSNCRRLLTILPGIRQSARKFSARSSDYYWSSSTNAYDPDDAWDVDFDDGDADWDYKDDYDYVRCVRGGPW